MQKIWVVVFLLIGFSSFSQEAFSAPPKEELQAPDKIEVNPTAEDFEIETRIETILQATGWFTEPKVEVRAGVVFLKGDAKSEELKKWASDLANNTKDVSAVVNKMHVLRSSPWDFRPVIQEADTFIRRVVHALPSLALAFIVFLVFWFFAKFSVFYSKKFIFRNVASNLLQDVFARCLGVFVFILGFYLIFQILGLTTIALTLLGGTGAIGIVLGIAFRDITENLLASVFLSIHHPFRNGDYIAVDGVEGYVQRLNVRSTVLLSIDGDDIQIPNATIYKSTIRNFTVNPNHRVDFSFQIPDEGSLSNMQEGLLACLLDHPALLKDPEPCVLVESIANDTVFVRVYFWVNAKEYSWVKVRSSVMRRLKQALVDMKRELSKLTSSPKKEEIPTITDAEGGLGSESAEMSEQAKMSRKPEKGDENLLVILDKKE